ncbi:MAG: tRNA dihydrouridine synthase DusB [Deltaproteobacteria bacterium]|nr:tRNA dihydrouridine synthase DusB [Deltaproteobacteria bacterium]
MHIGTLELENPFLLAPLAGISDSPYRRIMRRAGAALVFSEMISANGLVHGNRQTCEMLRAHVEERPLAIQLFGTDPEVMAKAARQVAPLCAVIDLNFGCPAPKVLRGGAGAALLRDPQRLEAIVAAVRGAITQPLTVKIRSGWDASSINYEEVSMRAARAGADAVTLHPRTRAQGFDGTADWLQLRRLKEILSIPVIGSGDLFTADDAMRMLSETGCDAVMLARGALGAPWIFRQLAEKMAGGEGLPPTVSERRSAVLLHYRLQQESVGEHRAVVQMRKHLSWYSRGMNGASQFRALVNRLDDPHEVLCAVEEFFRES